MGLEGPVTFCDESGQEGIAGREGVGVGLIGEVDQGCALRLELIDCLREDMGLLGREGV